MRAAHISGADGEGQLRRRMEYELGNFWIVIYTIRRHPGGLLFRDHAHTSPMVGTIEDRPLVDLDDGHPQTGRRGTSRRGTGQRRSRRHLAVRLLCADL